MPSRSLVARDLAELMKVLAHPDRIRLIEELRINERDVSGIADKLNISGSRVSQHLSLLRAHRLVEDRREGRSHFYRLAQPALASWIIEALDFVDVRNRADDGRHIDTARRLWTREIRDRTN